MDTSDISLGLSYDDVLLVPGYSEILPNEINTHVKLAGKISLKIPILSAAMDTVTDARLASALAVQGGAGVIHRNFSVEEQARQVAQVKEALSWIIHRPITITSSRTVREAYRAMEDNNINALPIVDEQKLVGIVTRKDLVLTSKLDSPVENVMNKNPICYEGTEPSVEDMMQMFREHRVGRIMLVDEKKNLVGLVTLNDFYSKQSGNGTENAAVDSKGRLVVGAAVSPHGLDERSKQLVKAGADFLVVDSAHGHSRNVIEAVRKLKEAYPKVPVVGGNVATVEATKALIKAGADVIKVGMGPGSICTTRIVSGMGMPQFTAVAQCAAEAAAHGAQVIADGGIRFSGDIAKAIGAGAVCVMLGSMFAGLDETPGKQHMFAGRMYKLYRGMGSSSAIAEGSGDRYQFSVGERIVAEGVEARVPYKGPLQPYLYQLVTGLKKGMGYCGCKTIPDLMQYGKFTRVTNAGIIESRVHDVEAIDD